jgi:hypothetical protein
MTPESWADVANWVLLAVGAAMAGGTGLAVLHHRRDGVTPGQQPGEHGAPAREPSPRGAYAKVVVGVLVALYGVAGLTADRVLGL